VSNVAGPSRAAMTWTGVLFVEVFGGEGAAAVVGLQHQRRPIGPARLGGGRQLPERASVTGKGVAVGLGDAATPGLRPRSATADSRM
jgi:hypothetical protein